jgi:hypothetical protein
MRIAYSFRKKGRFWVVTCLSDKSTQKSIFNSLNEAINELVNSHEGIELFDIIIPLSVSTPINITKPIRTNIIHERKYKISVMAVMKRLYRKTH